MACVGIKRFHSSRVLRCIQLSTMVRRVGENASRKLRTRWQGSWRCLWDRWRPPCSHTAPAGGTADPLGPAPGRPALFRAPAARISAGHTDHRLYKSSSGQPSVGLRSQLRKARDMTVAVLSSVNSLPQTVADVLRTDADPYLVCSCRVDEFHN